MDNTILYTIIIATFLFFVLTFFIIYMAVIQNRKKLFFKQELLGSQLEIQEQTFNSISQEIHDNVGQILSLVKVQMNIMEENEHKDKALLDDARDNISKAMTDLRDIAKGLNSERIRVIGLAATVEQEVQRINRVGIVHIRFTVEGAEKKIDNQKQLILFRVIQESLQNIIKHAAASAVIIRFVYHPHMLEIQICDDGKGFNFQQEQQTHHGLGLQNMYKRMEMIGGKVAIKSAPMEGTTVTLNIEYV